VPANVSYLKFYINDTLVLYRVDPTLTNGKVGISMYKEGSGPNYIWVDWAQMNLNLNTSAFNEEDLEVALSAGQVELEGGTICQSPEP
jgi:hypothetical protein